MADKADFHDADATAAQEPSGPSAGQASSSPGGSAGSGGGRNLPVPGQLSAGKYLIEAELSRSGQGIVFKAYSKVLDRHTALKVPLAQGPAGDEASWHEEARRLCDLAHPNIVRVLDAGSAEGTPYVATELIEGLPLGDYVRQKPLRARQILHWMIQLVDALAAIHAKGITHRDLKPGNVIVRSDGRPVLIDFGISTRVTAYGPEPQAGSAGTVAWMAPEQARPDAAVDHRADIFAMGGILKFLMSGTSPYGHMASREEYLRAARTAQVERVPAGPAG